MSIQLHEYISKWEEEALIAANEEVNCQDDEGNAYENEVEHMMENDIDDMLDELICQDY